MTKFRFTAKVTHPDHNPGHASGTLEAATTKEAEREVRDWVSRHRANSTTTTAPEAKDIKVTPED